MQPIIALGCGLVGEYVIHRLADDGHQVTAVDIRIPTSLIQRKDVSSIEQDAHLFIESLGNCSCHRQYASWKNWSQYSQTFD